VAPAQHPKNGDSIYFRGRGTPRPGDRRLLRNREARLAGRFPGLEDQLAGLIIGGDYQAPAAAPTAPMP
jgi:hypothetical protein